MNDADIRWAPEALPAIVAETERLGFRMASEAKTGAFLASLAASKPGGRILELGTGTGYGTSWLLAGMDSTSRLDTVDRDPTVLAVARRYLGGDPRVEFHLAEGAHFLRSVLPHQFDLVFADAWAGKFTDLDEALALLKVGGIYVIDDLLPQLSWPPGHAPNVDALVERLDVHPAFRSAKLSWATGLMIAVRTGAPN